MPEIQSLAAQMYASIAAEVQAAEELLTQDKFGAYVPRCKALVQKAPMPILYSKLAHAQWCQGHKPESVSAELSRVFKCRQVHVFCLY